MKNVVELRQLSKRYDTPAGPVQALDKLSLSVAQGEIFGLLGPNGAGKTTAIEIAVGLRRADSGTVSIFGKDPVSDNAWVRSHVGVQPQEVKIFPHQKVEEILSFWGSLYPDSYPVNDIVHWLGLEDLLSRKVSKLSGGQHQRLNVGLALVGKPKVVFLDEPSTGLDVIAREKLWDVLRQLSSQGMTIVLSTHNLEEATALCDDVGVVNGGKVVAQGSPQRLIRSNTQGSVVSCQINGADRSAVKDQLKALGEVVIQGDSVLIRTKSVDEVLKRLAQIGSFTNLTIKEPSLNDVFKNLVGHDFEKQATTKAGQ